MKNSCGLTSRLYPSALRFLNCLLVLTLILPWLVGVGQASPPLEQGSVIFVNSTEDVKKNDDQCTLREAIIAANSDKRSGARPNECPAGNGTDTIYLAAPPDPLTGIARYSLSRTDNGKEDAAETGDLDITGSVTIAPDPNLEDLRTVIIDASGITDRAFQILSGNVTIKGATITKNDGVVAGDGGGIHNSGNLTLENSTLSDNHTAARGGGIYNAGVLTLKSSTIGGKGTTVGERGNTAGDSGGAIANASSGSVTLNNSTVSGNTATNAGGGIFNMGLLALHNTTIAFNRADNGGGIVNSSASGTVNIRNTIIAGNTLADNTTPSNCSGTLSTQGYNLVSDTSCGLSGIGDKVDPNPGLDDRLKDNGGETETHALLVNSPAIDAGDPLGCFGSDGLLTTDQRDQPRPLDGNSDGSFLCDIGAFEVGRNSLVLLRAFPDPELGGTTIIHGLLDGAADTLLSDLDLRFFSTDTVCTFDPSQPLAVSIPPGFEKTDENGYFIVNTSDNLKRFVAATAIAPGTGDTLQSQCVPVGPPNDSWLDAFELTLAGDPPLAVVDTHYIDKLGQSRWYKFKVEPNSKLFVTLSGLPTTDSPLPANYDLTLYKDIKAAFEAILEDLDSEDLVRLGAEFAGDSYSGDSYSGDSYSGDSYSAISYSGDSYSGDSYSGDSYSGDSYSGDSYSGDSYSGDSYSGDSYSGDSYSGDSYSGDSYSGDSYSAAVFGGDSYSAAFSSAQSRSLIAVSAFSGTSPEKIFVRTWLSNEDFYVRVRGRNGAFSLDAPFRLEVRLEPGSCSNVQSLSDFAADPVSIGPDNPKTLILIDMHRMKPESEGGKGLMLEGDDAGALAALLDLENGPLAALANEVGGKIIDVNESTRVVDANDQADMDEYVDCPFAKNVVAQAIKADIVDVYRTQQGSNLEYVVIIGVDNIIPFFRHPDNANLVRESQYVPPVLDGTPSQAQLKLDYVLSQDAYGSTLDISLNNSTFPIPGLAVGRLGETATEINKVIQAFRSVGGVVTPDSSLATGYDFLEDTALEIEDQFRLGTDNEPDDLIMDKDLPPTDPSAWTADDLRTALLGSRHDLVFLAGHFSANSALAADYTTRLTAEEVAANDPEESGVDLSNMIVFSIGCHAGYNIVKQDEVPNVTLQPDWVQAFAAQGATLIAGTGYQYGETITQEYSERLYIEFSRQLRASGQVPIGKALVEAKKAYLIQVPQVRGLHEKALLQTTIFGLPMLKVNMPGTPFDPTLDNSIVTSVNSFTTNPGAALGLKYADISVTSPLNENPVMLLQVDDENERLLDASYLSGTEDDFVTNPIVTNPQEPFLPLEIRNVTVDGTVLRGVGFRGGTFSLDPDVLAVTGAPTTELVALVLSWQTDYFYPIRIWNPNYIGALIDGQTRIMVTPAQHIAAPPSPDGVLRSTRRKFREMQFRLFYSNNVEDPGEPDGHRPALSSEPSIIRVSAIDDSNKVTFRMTVVGDPAAGIQAVWVTWFDASAECPCTWQSLDLTQRESDTTLWEGTLEGVDPTDIRYMVQAVNGVGLVSMATNLGHLFTPGLDTIPEVETKLTLETNPGSGIFDSQATFKAKLIYIDENGAEQPLANQPIDFRLGGSQSRRAVTGVDGTAEVTLNVVGLPGQTEIKVAFDGTPTYKPKFVAEPFTIIPQQTQILDLADVEVFPGQDSGIVIRLVDQTGEPLRERTVFIVVTDPSAADPDEPLFTVSDITNFDGKVSLGVVPLEPGKTYKVTVFFNDNPFVGLTSDSYEPAPPVSAMLTILEPPCSNPGTTLHDPDDPTNDPDSIWPPNGELWRVDVNVDDPTSDGRLTVTIDSIQQDEEVGSVGPDAWFTDNPTSVELRAERDGNENGRIYVIGFTADDGQGFTCTGQVLVPVVPHDQGGEISGNPEDYLDPDGVLFDSTEAPKNDPPVANDDFNTTDEETVLTVEVTDAGNVLANDTDANPQDVLTVTAVNGQAIVSGTNSIMLPSGALVTMQPDGSYEYNPIGQFDNLAIGGQTTDTFEYTVSDGKDVSTATVTITINGVNDDPVANDDPNVITFHDTAVDIDVTANDTDVDGTIVKTSVTVGDGFNGLKLPDNGSVTVIVVDPDTVFVIYTPDPDFFGEDTFEYQVCDDVGDCDTATVTVTVVGNIPPVANDDQATTDEGIAVDIDVTFNDTDGEDALDKTSVTVGDGFNGLKLPDNGSVTVTVVDPDTVFVTYTPDPDFFGEDTFEYQVCDDAGDCDTATVTVVVEEVNDEPVINPDEATTDEETPVDINVTANDFDEDGAIDPDSVTIVTQPISGTAVTDTTPGVVTYTPNPDFFGEDTFEYQVCNTDQPDPVCGGALVIVTVININDDPEANPDEATTTQGTPTEPIDVLFNDVDVDGDTLTVILIGEPGRGTVTTNPDGTLTYTPNSNFKGTDSFTYTISDGHGGAPSEATVTITITGKSDG